ncbi:MAG: hypothetical protein CBC71_06220 [Rhodobacteraceae bacterium TMED111]|nr:hypothetical protein [Marinovum sp.]OUV41094.1 MAG: hypothetical protein CBC71_06220 [Rhodobacteraceae bacterium TMED111]|tara:strand:- start:20072 stop:20632 length:561 start_codon:yes stop_codon:yes gene_type:complete
MTSKKEIDEAIKGCNYKAIKSAKATGLFGNWETTQDTINCYDPKYNHVIAKALDCYKKALERKTVDVEGLKKRYVPIEKLDSPYDEYFTENEVNAYNLAIDDLTKHGFISTQWKPIEEAPRYEELFCIRRKDKAHVQFEAMFFRERESWEMPEEYDVLQNMTLDEPIENWDMYEWKPLPQPPKKEV